MVLQHVIDVATSGRGMIEVTDEVRCRVAEAGLTAGLCNVFVQHTSASLFLNENADPAVRRDLEVFFADLVPDGDPRFTHTAEGADDMPAHVRAVLTTSTLTLPISAGGLALGTWQGIYLWEHRKAPHRRRLLVTLYGDD
ncbi:MAG: secondary thiamine-phosphate synthase enzyme YjbQ [Gammaproteobacteria bacterium]